MKTIDKIAAQGDVLFVRIDKLPEGLTRETHKTAAHSETGHMHAFDDSASVWLYSTSDQLEAYLEVEEPAVLRHHRVWDTHEEIEFPVGVYKIRRQREHTPDGWRQVMD